VITHLYDDESQTDELFLIQLGNRLPKVILCTYTSTLTAGRNDNLTTKFK